MVELKNVYKYYNSNGVITKALNNVSLSFQKNEIVAITGESGSGKSTLLNVICGIDSYNDGEIYFKGNETSYFDNDDLDLFRKNNVSFIYQNYNIIESYNVLDNVMLPLLIKGLSKQEAKKRALELIKEVGLEHRIKNKGSDLSGGEKQRCVIARALATDAEILACDEPTGNLDSETGKEIIDLIKRVAKDKLVLIVTHNYEEVKPIITRTIKLIDGEVVEDYEETHIEEDNIKEELNLADKKVKRSTLFSIAINNLLAMPKKNIFSTIVLTVMGFITLFFFLAAIELNNNVSKNVLRGYLYYPNNKIVIYDFGEKDIDYDKLNNLGSVYKNAFYEDTTDYEISINDSSFYSKLSYYGGITEYNKGIIDINGNLPTNEDEIFIIIPKDDRYYNSETIEKYCKNNDTIEFEGNTYKLSGYGYSEALNYGMDFLVLTTNAKKFTMHYKLVFKNESNNLQSYVVSPDLTNMTEIDIVDSNIDNINIYLGPHKLDVSKYKINTNQSKYLINVGKDFLSDDVLEITLYANDVNKAKAELDSLGYQYLLPSEGGIQKQSIDYIKTVFTIIAFTILALLLVLVSYAILSRLYHTKDKDYEIMRSLGLIKKQLSKIVIYELLILGILASINTFIIYFILNFVPYMKDVTSTLNIFISIYFVIIMIIFTYLIARRFNKKLFKFTVLTSIKGDKKND